MDDVSSDRPAGLFQGMGGTRENGQPGVDVIVDAASIGCHQEIRVVELFDMRPLTSDYRATQSSGIVRIQVGMFPCDLQGALSNHYRSVQLRFTVWRKIAGKLF